MDAVVVKVRDALHVINKSAHAAVDAHAGKAVRKSPLGRKYQHVVATWEAAWERFIPFLEFPPDLRRVISFPPHSCGRHPPQHRVAELATAHRSSRTAASFPTTPR